MGNYKNMSAADFADALSGLNRQYEEYKQMNLKLDMSRGKPAPEQLDLSMDIFNSTEFMGSTGIDARNYGNLEGMPETRAFFAEMMGVDSDEVFVGGNSSLNMMYNMIELGCRKGFLGGNGGWSNTAKPKFLCPAPGYDRHFRITEYFGFELISVPMTENGPDMDIVEKLVQDEDVKGIWCVPKYSNPDGYTYSDETVKRLVGMAVKAPDFKIFWDNAYCVHHLSDEQDELLNIMQEAKNAGTQDRVFIFCSLSKVTFSGASVGAMSSSKDNMSYILENSFSMTIGFDKINQLRHTLYFKNMDGVAKHMQKHRAIVRPKFDKVLEILARELGDENADWTNPNGGYFISLFLPHGCAKRTVQLCKEAGVVLTGAGAAYPYGVDPNDTHIRIAPTYPPIAELDTATNLLCICAKIAIAEKLSK